MKKLHIGDRVKRYGETGTVINVFSPTRSSGGVAKVHFDNGKTLNVSNTSEIKLIEGRIINRK